ncbi:MAG: hypothetical protein JNM76_10595 [Betaproteobacteria bacterium]|nr:hypothetical protein [Betaproteobacteria bacterium]
MKFLNLAGAAFAILVGFNVSAQDAKPADTKKRTVALISAVGDQFTYLRQKESVGSNMEPYSRRIVKVPNGGLDNIVLRGLDKAYSAQDPDANKIFMRLAAPEMEGVLPQHREKVAIDKVMEQLAKVDRSSWDLIVAVTPAWQFSATGGMGSKLQGIGLYVQPLENTVGDFDSELGGQDEFTTSDPNDRAKKKKSNIYVAPYSYTQLWVIDPKTLSVISKETHKQHTKLFDPNSASLDVQKQMTVDMLATQIEGFVERASTKALKDAIGTVTVEEKLPPGAKKDEPAKK